MTPSAALQSFKKQVIAALCDSTSFPQHKPRLHRIQQLKRIHKPHAKVLADVGDQKLAAGSEVRLLMRHSGFLNLSMNRMW